MGESAGIRPDSASRMLALGAEFDARTGGEWLMLGQSSGGATRSWVPTLGSVVWVVWEPYYAYMFEMSAGQWVGYVRVSDYEYDRKAVKEFEKIIARFERETVAMIFDQIDNTGGSMFQMYALLSTLTDKALALPTHEIMISDDDAAIAASVVEDAKAGESVPTDERPSGELVAYSHLVLTEWVAGRGTPDRPSSPLYLGGVAENLPAKTHYTKKIVVLINGETFSAGEFLAAILQDNERATLFGTTTGAEAVAQSAYAIKP